MNPIGLLKKAFKIFQKKTKADSVAPDAPFEPDDNVVLVFGHSNSGKTVYFSVLYELLKGNDNFKLSPLNNETAAALIENYNLMRGKELKIKEGRQVEIDAQRRFPTMTSETRVLKFGLDLPMRKGVKFYTVDYKGETLAITEPGALRKKFAEFFPFARAALFFIDASVLDTDVLLREQIAAFQTIVHDLRECIKGKIPIGIVITKSDFLDGYSSANSARLIEGLSSIHKGRRKGSFASAVARVNNRRFGEKWAKTTERITNTLGNLIDSMVGYNLDFQVFFVSATGGIEKADAGSVQPPRDLKPSGIDEPLIWGFNRIMFNKRRAKGKYLVKWVFGLSLLFTVVFSLFNVYHLWKLYDRLDRADREVERFFADRNPPTPISWEDADRMIRKYQDYLDRIPIVRFLGAGSLIDYAEEKKAYLRSIISADAVASTPSESAPKGWDEPTMAALKDYNKMAASVGKQPPDQQLAGMEAGVEGLWEKHPKEGLDPKFVAMVEGNLESFGNTSEGFADKEFELKLEFQKLGSNRKVTMQIGDNPKVDFTKFAGTDNNPEKMINGKGNEPIIFTFYNLNDPESKPLIESIADPIKDFYPQLTKGFVLGFGKEYGIIVKRKSGRAPKAPSINMIR